MLNLNGAYHEQGGAYWRMPFKPMLTSRQLTEYVVLDVEPSGHSNNKFVAADIQASATCPIMQWQMC